MGDQRAEWAAARRKYLLEQQGENAPVPEGEPAPVVVQVADATAAYFAAKAVERDAQLAVATAAAQAKQALSALADTFLSLYNALPTEARNKVRQTINTARFQRDDDAIPLRLGDKVLPE